MRGTLAQRVLARVSASRFAMPLRRAFNAVIGQRLRVVQIPLGLARGARLELNLSREKAYWLGFYERDVQDVLGAHLSQGAVFYDVGAHIGFFSVCAGLRGAKVFAFEPVAENAERLRRNVALNRLDVQVVERAVWDVATPIALLAGPSDSEWRGAPGNGPRSLTLDSFATKHEPPNVLKIDAEGAEARILRGASRLLTHAQPLVVCELHSDEGEAELLELLQNYEIERLAGGTRLVARPKPTNATGE